MTLYTDIETLYKQCEQGVNSTDELKNNNLLALSLRLRQNNALNEATAMTPEIRINERRLTRVIDWLNIATLAFPEKIPPLKPESDST